MEGLWDWCDWGVAEWGVEVSEGELLWLRLCWENVGLRECGEGVEGERPRRVTP